jgi:peroxiredoxin (alkyl hydroperoxide reductase subunit C)
LVSKGPRLNEPAPSFEAETTHGSQSLDDYKDRWLVLFSHPSDFTPVCTTEFIAFVRAHAQFDALGCDLLGLSIDSVFSHIAWARSIEDDFGVEIPFPVIADLSMSVAAAYGMIQPGASNTEAVRAVVIIDPKSVLRALLYYPMSAERSIPEILRLVQAMQLRDEHGVVTPEGWKPGDTVITKPLRTLEEARARKRDSYGCRTWCFSTSPAPAGEAEVSR